MHCEAATLGAIEKGCVFRRIPELDERTHHHRAIEEIGETRLFLVIVSEVQRKHLR